MFTSHRRAEEATGWRRYSRAVRHLGISSALQKVSTRGGSCSLRMLNGRTGARQTRWSVRKSLEAGASSDSMELNRWVRIMVSMVVANQCEATSTQFCRGFVNFATAKQLPLWLAYKLTVNLVASSRSMSMKFIMQLISKTWSSSLRHWVHKLDENYEVIEKTTYCCSFSFPIWRN